MKGDIINCSTQQDIYFLEANNTKAESGNLKNLLTPSSNRDMFKYKPRQKLKQKLNPALEFFIHNNSSSGSFLGDTTPHHHHHHHHHYHHDDHPPHDKNGNSTETLNKSLTTSSSSMIQNYKGRNSIDELYDEAAAILGLTCSQTDNCKCIDCQCHYFDFEDELDYSEECLMDQNSTCTIQ